MVVDRPSVRPSVRPTDRPAVRPSVRPSVRPFVRSSVRPTVRPFVRPSVRPFVRRSDLPTVRPSARWSVRPSDVNSKVVFGKGQIFKRTVNLHRNHENTRKKLICAIKQLSLSNVWSPKSFQKLKVSLKSQKSLTHSENPWYY